jgi:nucleotide-binding universal stress UspA family protein
MTILVAVSRTHLRDNVLDVGISLAQALGRELYVVHLVENGSPDTPSQIRKEIRERVLEESVVATVAVEPVDTALVRTGSRLGRKLLDVAADAEASHIVVGHTSRGLLGDVTEGSTAFTVADTASVPVTIIPEARAGT